MYVKVEQSQAMIGSSSSDILILCEVGASVGWGHLVRALILYKILRQTLDVRLRIVNRDFWLNQGLARAFSLNKDHSYSCKTLIVDGVLLRESVNKIHFTRLISLSFVADINKQAELVIAPALLGQKVPANYCTSLEYLLYRSGTPSTRARWEPIKRLKLGILLGSTDIDHLEPSILNMCRKFPRLQTCSEDRHSQLLSWEDIVIEELLSVAVRESTVVNKFASCDLVLTQGGLNALELVSVGVPILLRRRVGFQRGYQFLIESGFAFALVESSTSTLEHELEGFLSNPNISTVLESMRNKRFLYKPMPSSWHALLA